MDSSSTSDFPEVPGSMLDSENDYTEFFQYLLANVEAVP
jgi:hypothetical protein